MAFTVDLDIYEVLTYEDILEARCGFREPILIEGMCLCVFLWQDFFSRTVKVFHDDGTMSAKVLRIQEDRSTCGACQMTYDPPVPFALGAL